MKTAQALFAEGADQLATHWCHDASIASRYISFLCSDALGGSCGRSFYWKT
jgi:hypothetical protein